MITTSKRIRKDYAPLTAAVSVECLSTGSPTTQVYDSEQLTDKYQPDREITPTVLCPRISVSAKDSESLLTTYDNTSLAQMKWYVNGVDITTDTDWSGLYSITTTGTDKGAITIRRNVPVGTQYTLRFEAVIYDSRLAVNVPIVSDEIILSTAEKSADQFMLALDEADSATYNPIEDKLLLYRYKVAKGLTTASDTAEAAATVDGCYKHSVEMHLWKGKNEITDYTGYTVTVAKMVADDTGNLTETELDAELDELIEFAPPALVFDMRLIEDATYVVTVSKNGRVVARRQVSLKRIYPKYEIQIQNTADFSPAVDTHKNMARVTSGGKVLEHPEVALRMLWGSETATLTKTYNEGTEVELSLSEAGVGDTEANSYVDVYIDSEQKSSYKIATDANGVIYTDEEGNPYIFN